MAPRPPDVFAFRSKFAEFGDDIEDAEINLSLEVAKLWVDPLIWSEADYPLGILFFAAHFLSLKQQQVASAELGGTGSVDLFVRSVGFGERRVMFGERGSISRGEGPMAPGESMLNYTTYGMIYLQLRGRNVPSVAVI